jgi:general stress protein 26
MQADFIKKGLELIKKADAAYLTTVDSYGFPSTRAMLNLKNRKQFPKLIDFMDKSIKDKIWLDEWKMYFSDGKDSEDYAILKLKPMYVKSYFRFKQSDLKL